MACIGCDFNLPKASAKGQALESKAPVRRYLEEVPLTADEGAIFEGVSKRSRGLSASWKACRRWMGIPHVNNESRNEPKWNCSAFHATHSLQYEDAIQRNIMDPIRGSSAYSMQNISSANPAQTVQAAAGANPSGHSGSLTWAMLSDYTVNALSGKEAQGNEREKMLAGFAKQAIGSGLLQLSPNQTPSGIAQFGMQRNQDVLVIKAKLNENDRSKYDVLSVGFRRGSGAPVSMILPSPSRAASGTARPPSALLCLPNELLLQIAGGTGHRGEGVNLSLREVSHGVKLMPMIKCRPNSAL
jgi:hypothetical protein